MGYFVPFSRAFEYFIYEAIDQKTTSEKPSIDITVICHGNDRYTFNFIDRDRVTLFTSTNLDDLSIKEYTFMKYILTIKRRSTMEYTWRIFNSKRYSNSDLLFRNFSKMEKDLCFEEDMLAQLHKFMEQFPFKFVHEESEKLN